MTEPTIDISNIGDKAIILKLRAIHYIIGVMFTVALFVGSVAWDFSSRLDKKADKDTVLTEKDLVLILYRIQKLEERVKELEKKEGK